jgi:sRNA-binding protein
MRKTFFVAITALIQLLGPWPTLAASPCGQMQEKDQGSLRRCIAELQKEVEQNRLDMQALKTENASISKQLCMLAIEQHRGNARSEALKLIIENTCVKFKSLHVPEEHL